MGVVKVVVAFLSTEQSHNDIVLRYCYNIPRLEFVAQVESHNGGDDDPQA